ncbi:MAG TPA: glycosyltransferase family 4 protein [Vicinamibacterales bacterium]
MRVLHVHSGNLFGGVETFLLTLAAESRHAPSMTSDFAVCFDGAFSARLTTLGRAPHVLGEVRLSRPNSVRRARTALRELLRQTSPDVVVCQQPWSCVVFGSVVREMGYPLVLWVHMASDGRHWLERAAKLTSPDVVLANSRYTASRVAQWLPRVSNHVAYCPVSIPDDGDGSVRWPLRHDLGVDDARVVVTMVARAEAWKGHRVLLEACSRLRDLPHWECWMVGGAQRPAEADYLASLHGAVDQLGLGDRIKWLGARADVPAILAASDIYCQPNLEPEPFGLSLVEALLAGVPVVTSAAGGALEIVDDSCGTLTPPGDARAVADALRALIADPDRRERMGAAGRRRSRALCAPEAQLPYIERLLSSTTRRKPGNEEARRVG